MADPITAAVAFIGAEIGGATGAFLIMNAEAIAMTAIAVASVSAVREQQRRAQAAQRDSYNASLRDRYAMVRAAAEPRKLVLGRQRVSGSVFFIASYGDYKEHLVFCVELAGHELDGIEHIYFDDERLVIDEAGNVLNINRHETFSLAAASDTFTLTTEPGPGLTAEVAYGSTILPLTTSVTGKAVTVSGGRAGETGTVTIIYQPATSPYGTGGDTLGYEPLAIDGAGNGTVTLPHDPVGSIEVVYTGPGDGGSESAMAYTTVAGRVVTVTGYPLTGLSLTVTYQYRSGSITKARVRKYLGTDSQAADAGMIAALPGVWTSAHRAAGVAYLVVELDYDPDTFPGGLPNVSAQVRGLKCFDPRTGTTAWTENAALLTRAAALHELCGRLPPTSIHEPSFISTANVCDQAATYLVNGQPVVRARYTAGTVHKSGTRAMDTLNDLTQAMGGKWVFVDGLLRVKAGAYTPPLQTLDESWLSTAGGITVQPEPARSDLVNVITGTFADQDRDYKPLSFPNVEAAAYIADDGAELPLDVTLGAVTHVAQAQQVAAMMMRDSRQGLRVTLTCNMRAYPVEPFDTLRVSLARYGWENKLFETLDVSWALESGITLQLKETDPSIYEISTEFSADDPAPNTRLPPPNVVPPVLGLAAAAGDDTQVRQADGTVVQRLRVSWDAITDAAVLGSGGGVQIQYGLAHLPVSEWISVDVAGGQTAQMLTGIEFGSVYRLRARAFNALCRGAWCDPISVRVEVRSIIIDTDQLLVGAATDTMISSGGAGAAGRPGGLTGPTDVDVVVRSWTWTNNVRSTPVTVQFEGGLADSTLGWNDAYPTGLTKATLTWSSASLSGAVDICTQWPDSTSQKGNINPVAFAAVDLPAGETLTVSLKVRVQHTHSALISWGASYLRGSAIKS